MLVDPSHTHEVVSWDRRSGGPQFQPGTGAEFPPPSAVQLQRDGKILLIPALGPSPCLARFTPNGSVDSSFALDPRLAVDGNIVTALALQADGRIVIGGGFWTLNLVLRLLPDGRLYLRGILLESMLQDAYGRICG